MLRSCFFYIANGREPQVKHPCEITLTWSFKGYLFRGPHNKDCRILGSTLGYPYFWELPLQKRVQGTAGA